MKKITAYQVVNKKDIRELVDAVNDKIAEGWQPYGQLVLDQIFPPSSGPIKVFAQAMVKYEE